MIALSPAAEVIVRSTAGRLDGKMELWTLELVHKSLGYEETELRGVFTSYRKACDAIDVPGYWTTYITEYGKAFENLNLEPFYKDEFGNTWHIYKVVTDTLLPSDWSSYNKGDKNG